MPNDELVDIFGPVDDILKRIDCTTLSLSPDDYEAGRRSYAALRYNGADAAKPERKRRERKPNVATMIKQAEKTGKTVTSVTVEGVTLTFDQPSPAKRTSWDDLETGTRQ
jgi:hypothetical protein